MNDESIIFFCILMIVAFLYRIIISIRLLFKKTHMIDEKYYVLVFYFSLVGIIVLFTNSIIAGLVLAALTPIVMLIYVSINKNRRYWIVNGYNLTESTFLNPLIEYNEKYQDFEYRSKVVKLSKKKKESRIELVFVNNDYEEKEKILSMINQILKEKVDKSNKKELTKLILYVLAILFLSMLIIFALFI